MHERKGRGREQKLPKSAKGRDDLVFTAPLKCFVKCQFVGNRGALNGSGRAQALRFFGTE
jgi:hypothetical protein